MPLTSLRFKPGINREATSYSNAGGWFNGDKIRFRFGNAEKIGGWSTYSDNTFLGTCRALFSWVALDGTNFLGVGTNLKYYIANGGVYNDITPIRDTTAAGDATFSASNGSTIITVTEDAHGALLNDFVTFSGAVLLGSGGVVSATVLNKQHQVSNVISNNSYQIDVASSMNTTAIDASGGINASVTSVSVDDTSSFQSAGTLKIGDELITYSGKTADSFTGLSRGALSTTAAAHDDDATITEMPNSSDSGNGGSATVAKYEINTRLDTNFFGTGWGAGVWNGVDTSDSITTLAEALDASETGIDVTSATGISATDIISVEDELMLVGSISSNTLTVTRGHGGTTAATHLNGLAVRLRKGNDIAAEDTVTLINDGSGLTAVATTVTVDSAANFASSGHIKIGDEIIEYTGTTSTTFTGLVRGSFATTATTHADNAAVFEANFGWGMPATSTVAGSNLSNWTHDNFGEDLLLNVKNGGIYYWDRTSGIAARAIELKDVPNSILAPTIAKQIMVSDQSRHIIAFGCDGEGSIGTQDPLLIRFGSQESLIDFQTRAENTAGELRISTGSEIVVAIQTKQQILVYTDVSLHGMQFLGDPFTFGLTEISRNITIAGPNAAIAVNDFVFWMGSKEFYVYGGTVQRLPCTVLDYVFSDFNRDQIGKVYAGHNSSYGEVWWFYPSKNSTVNDRYVIYNYQEKIWYFGNLARTAWVDRGINQYPIAASTDNKLYYHEFGQDDGSTNPPSAISANIESSQMDIGDGEKFTLVRRVLPDVTFRDSTSSTPKVNMVVKARNFPGVTFNETTSKEVSRSVSTPVELFTEQLHVRLRGRSFAFRIESDATGVMWRLGTPRVDIRPDGQR